MKHTTCWIAACSAMAALILNSASAAVITFENVPLPAAGYWNGSDGTGGITVDGVTLNNSYTDYGAPYYAWYGFAVSNLKDTSTPGYGNQYSASTGEGAASSANYAVGYYSAYDAVNFGATTNLTFSALTDMTGQGASFTNTTYAALSMRYGDSFSKKFGGSTGNDADWFKLTIQGYAAGTPTAPVDFYLADYRFTDNTKDSIVTDWQYVDFTPLGSVDRLVFSMTSSDNNSGGMRTPSYFAMDNLTVPEPSSLWLALSGLGYLARRKR